jgi:hypothetical protein
MKFLYSLPVIAALTLVPMAATAQAAQLASQPSAAAPALVASADGPATFSSSVSSSADEPVLESRGLGAAAAAAAPAAPDTGSTRPFSSLGVGFKIGLGGIGFDAAVPIFPGRLNLRGGAGFLSYSGSFTVSNDNIAGTLKLNNAEIMGDFFPFKGSFRLSAGVTVYNNTAVNGTISVPAGGTLTEGNNKYYSDPAAPLGGTAALTFGGTAVPRFSFGWGNMVPKTGHRIRFETEFGIEYIGNPPVLWNTTGMGCTNAVVTGGTTCAPSGASSTVWGPVAPTDVAAQKVDLQNDVNDFKIFPIFQFGLSYKIH